MARDFNASNLPRTCLWCGRKLYSRSSPRGLPRRLAKLRELFSGAHLEREIADLMHAHERDKDRYGLDGQFDTGTCAELFGRNAARNGYRFEALTRCVNCRQKLDYDLPTDHTPGDKYMCTVCSERMMGVR